MLTPVPADLTRALLGQSSTPISAAQQLQAHLALSPSLLTPNVAAAMNAAGAAAAAAAAASQQESGNSNLQIIKSKLSVLKDAMQVRS
jgi:hypothetical protein